MERLARGGEQAEEEGEAKDGKDNEDAEDELEVESVDLRCDGVRFSTVIFPPMSGIALFSCSPAPTTAVTLTPRWSLRRASLVKVHDVGEGEEFVISYVFEGSSTASNRAHALTPYGFDCACTRCGKTADE